MENGSPGANFCKNSDTESMTIEILFINQDLKKSLFCKNN